MAVPMTAPPKVSPHQDTKTNLWLNLRYDTAVGMHINGYHLHFNIVASQGYMSTSCIIIA
jgi:hypothetical protein